MSLNGDGPKHSHGRWDEVEVRTRLRGAKVGLSIWRVLPIEAAIRRSKNRDLIEADLTRWMSVRKLTLSRHKSLRLLLVRVPEFRSLVYWRLGLVGRALSHLFPGRHGLHLYMEPRDVGPGFYIQHGDNSYVRCVKIGRNGWVNQGVTLGFTNDTDFPTLGDDVTVNVGAKVLGRVHIGDGVRIGPNAVVLRDVPDGSLVLPPSPRIIRP